MRVRRDLIHRQRYGFHAAGLSQNEPVAKMNRHSALQIGKSKGLLSIATVGRADQLKQRFILRDREQLAVAKRPSRDSKVAREHPYLTNIWLCHILSPLVA